MHLIIQCDGVAIVLLRPDDSECGPTQQVRAVVVIVAGEERVIALLVHPTFSYGLS